MSSGNVFAYNNVNIKNAVYESYRCIGYFDHLILILW
jgi:hypothetical protein